MQISTCVFSADINPMIQRIYSLGFGTDAQLSSGHEKIKAIVTASINLY